MAIQIIDIPAKEPIKLLTYKALLSQSGEDAPVARVLNQDEDDYLGDIIWERVDVGIYKGTNNNIKASLCLNSILSYYLPNDIIEGYDLKVQQDGHCELYVFQYGLQDGSIQDLPIEIKVRQRGTSPVLLSAETNTTGDKVILTFDKKMNSYLSIDEDENVFIFSNDTTRDGQGIAKNAITVNGNIIEFTTFIAMNNGDALSINCQSFTESLDYGLLQPFENFPLKNNVLATE